MSLELKGKVIAVKACTTRGDKPQKYNKLSVLSIQDDLAKVEFIDDFSGRRYEVGRDVSFSVYPSVYMDKNDRPQVQLRLSSSGNDDAGEGTKKKGVEV